ncbi:MAG: adenosylcobinamide-GDP ribazoletransferase [Acidimicrobiales bacterium]
MNGLVGAVAFLTRIPVDGGRTGHDAGAASLAATVPWFPVVGAVVGVTTAATYAAGLRFLPTVLAATLALAAQILLTGALHEDGLADVADAAGGASPEERRRIMDDPDHGTFGVLALVLSTVARVAALAGLDGVQALAALPAAGALGRGTAVAMMGAVAPVAGRGGLAAGYRRALSRRRVAAGLTAAVVMAAVAIGVWVLPAVALAGVTAWILGRWARRKLGGVTGDVLGATVIVVEVAALTLAAAAVASGGPALPWWR